MTPADSLLAAFTNRNALVGVIGLGYVGLPLAAAFHDAEFRVLGFDIDPAKIAMLARGENYIRHLGQDLTRAFATSGRFSATGDLARLAEPDAILVCVPTPLGRHREPDLSYVVRSARDIGHALRRGQLVVLESTTYPGTTRDEFLPALLDARSALGKALRLGEDFFVAFSPEREDPGRTSHTTRTTPKLVGGVDAASGDVAAALYRAAVERVVRVSSAEVAEAAKIVENTFRAVNIAMVNELKVLFTDMGIDVWEVIDAAATKPFGFMPFYPGPGLGGHCIPIDPFYLTWKAREVGRPTRFIELAGEINHAMPEYVVGRVTSALNERGKSVRGSRVLVLGLAYKPDIDDVRESPSFELIERLADLGAAVDYNDPHVARTHRMRRYDLGMQSVPLTPDSLRAYDAVLVSTNHAAYDWQMVADHAALVIDARNALRDVQGRRDHIIRA
jgi:UDP-N-acetyl-D-glucosamine dehydrogenase